MAYTSSTIKDKKMRFIPFYRFRREASKSLLYVHTKCVTRAYIIYKTYFNFVRHISQNDFFNV